MLDFRITNELSPRNLDATANLLIQPRLWIPEGDYPAHTDWRDKALAEIAAEKKRAMLAYWGNEEVGSVVYQRDPIDPRRVEVRNISIEPKARGRYVASFLLRQVEAEAPIDFPGVDEVVADTKRTNSSILAFAISNGYRIKAITALPSEFAHNGVEDVVLSKKVK
jgi:ribosomal protein S18 acetylase RimI-like enzyme